MEPTTQSVDMEQGDLQFLASLRREGCDLSQPAEIAAFVESPTLAGARMAAREARACGWDVSVHPSRDELTWVMRATRTMVPSWQAIVAMRDVMVAIAERADGSYDGWGIATP